MPGDIETSNLHFFLIEADRCADSVVRILGVFVVQNAEPFRVVLDSEISTVNLRVETRGKSDAQAANIRRKLESLVIVRGVVLGSVDLKNKA